MGLTRPACVPVRFHRPAASRPFAEPNRCHRPKAFRGHRAVAVRQSLFPQWRQRRTASESNRCKRMKLNRPVVNRGRRSCNMAEASATEGSQKSKSTSNTIHQRPRSPVGTMGIVVGVWVWVFVLHLFATGARPASVSAPSSVVVQRSTGRHGTVSGLDT